MRKKIQYKIDENLAACLAGRRKIARECKTREGLYQYLFRLEEEDWSIPPPLPARTFRARAKPRRAHTVTAKAAHSRRKNGVAV